MIRCRFIFEAQSNHKETAENALREMIKKFKNLEGINVYEEHWEPTEKVDNLFSALVDLGVEFSSFESLISALLRFGPSAVILESPETLHIDLGELQRTINDILAVVHAFAQANAALKYEVEYLKRQLHARGRK